MSDNNKKNDNRFLNVLSDIDGDLIQYALDDSIEPEIVTLPDKKQKILRYILPAAASLAVVAAVGIGAFIIGQNIPSEPGGNTATETTIREETEPSESKNSETTEPESTTEAAAPAETTHQQWTAKEILNQQAWQDINHYHNIDVNDKESIDIIPQFNKVNPYDNTHSGMLTGGIIDRESIGEYDVALLGFNMYIDTSRNSNGKFIIIAKELNLALIKNDKITATYALSSQNTPNEPLFFYLDKDHLKDYIQVFKFDDNSSIVAYRSISYIEPTDRVTFFGVNDGKFFFQHNNEAGDIKQNNANYLSTLTETAVEYADNGNKYYLITDNMTKARFRFEYFDNDTHNYIYFTKERANIITDITDFPQFELTDSLILNYAGSFEAAEGIDKMMPKAVISQIDKDGYTFSLAAENIYVFKDSDTILYCHNLQEVVTKNGKFVCNIPVRIDSYSDIDRSSILLSGAVYGNYDNYNLLGYAMDDTVLIINHLLLRDSTPFASDCCFYALKDDKLFNLDNADYSNVTDKDIPEWATGKEGYDLIVDTENKTVIYDYAKYEFNFDKLPETPNYTVSWLKEPLE